MIGIIINAILLVALVSLVIAFPLPMIGLILLAWFLTTLD